MCCGSEVDDPGCLKPTWILKNMCNGGGGGVERYGQKYLKIVKKNFYFP